MKPAQIFKRQRCSLGGMMVFTLMIAVLVIFIKAYGLLRSRDCAEHSIAGSFIT